MGERCPPITETAGMARHHRERHRTGRIGWLRAAVLGANDGIVSTASLVLVVLGRNNPSPYTVNGRPLYVHLNGLAIVLLK